MNYRNVQNDAKTDPPCTFHTDISVIRPSFKDLYDISGHLVKKVSYRFLKDGLITEILSETCNRGLFLHHFSSYP